jgi:hypothetical protein
MSADIDITVNPVTHFLHFSTLLLLYRELIQRSETLTERIKSH